MSLAGSWLTFLGVFLVVGVAGARWVRAPVASPYAHRSLAVIGALLALAGALVRLAAQVLAFVDPGEPVTWDAPHALLHSGWGTSWHWQAAAAFLALLLAFAPGRVAAVAAALALAATLPLTGHAGESPWGAPAGITTTAVHVLAGGLWLGTLAVLWLSRSSLGAGEHGAAEVRRIVLRFSPLALIAAVLLAVSGALPALWLVGSWNALLHSAYGQRLVAKLVLLAGLLAVAFVNWRVRRPALGTELAAQRLWRSVAVELALAVSILGVTATLAATAPPGLE